MCSVSAIIDDYKRHWPYPDPWKPNPPIFPPSNPVTIPLPDGFKLPEVIPSTPTQESINELIDLLKKAHKYDKETNQPNCEKPDLVKWLQEIFDKFDKHHRKVEKILNQIPKKKKRTRKK